MAITIGLLIGTSALALALFFGGSLGAADNFVSDQNLGAQYKIHWEADHADVIGVVKVLGVPVWDNGSGIGSRMPILMEQPTQSPVIFLGGILPVDYIVILRSLFAMLSALVVLNLTVLYWSDGQTYRRMIFMDLALLGPFFLFTAQNNWFVIADQYWAVCLIVSGFLHPSWYHEMSRDKKRSYPSIVLFAFTFGLGILLTGHILHFQLALVVLVVLFLRNCLKLRKILGLLASALICFLILILTAPQIIELSSQVWNSQSIDHSSQPSIFDFFMPSQFRVFRFQPLLAFVSASFQPLLRLANDAGPRTDFFNLLLLPYILQNFVRSKKNHSSLHQMLRVSVMSIAVIFLNLVFAGTLSRSGLPVIAKVFDFHVWELSTLLLPIIILVATIVFDAGQEIRYSSIFIKLINRIILLLALIMALMYPLIMLIKDAPRFDSTSTRVVQNEHNLDVTLESRGFEKNIRGILLVESSIKNLAGIDTKMIRSGYPLLNSIFYGRSSSTLRYPEQRFRASFQPSILDCQPEVLDLLSVNTIVFEASEDDVCSKNLKDYYRSSDEISFIKLPGSNSVLSVKPRQFSSWSITANPESNPIEPCPLFERDCLNGLTVTRLEPNSGAPFKLCDDRCVFTYRWSAPSSSRQVLVPENYDKTIQIRDLSTGAKLRTANYQGLLAVEISSGSSSGMFEATIKPDAMMWARVSATYIHTLILLSILILISVRGVRARKERSDAAVSA